MRLHLNLSVIFVGFAAILVASKQYGLVTANSCVVSVSVSKALKVPPCLNNTNQLLWLSYGLYQNIV
jgi:hypothetical protein